MKKLITICAAIIALNAASQLPASTFTFRNFTGKGLEVEIDLKLTILGFKDVKESFTIPHEGEKQIKRYGYCLRNVRIRVPGQEMLEAPIQGFTPAERAKVDEALKGMATSLGDVGKGVGDILSSIEGFETYGQVLKYSAIVGSFLYKKARVPDVCQSQHFEIILNYDADKKLWQPFVTYTKLK